MSGREPLWESFPPLPEAYSRVTDPERFRPLHHLALRLLEGLRDGYDVAWDATFDPLPGMTPFEHHRPPVTLTPVLPAAAPIGVAFSPFPSLALRYGRWLAEPFPSCACDACAETAEGEFERFAGIVRAVVAGRFREKLSIPLIRQPKLSHSLGMGEGWSTLSRAHARALRLRGSGEVHWEPWPKRTSS